MKRFAARYVYPLTDPEPIEKAFIPQENDFEPATSEERESIVEKHKSVSYWRDAARRFRANTVSMSATMRFSSFTFLSLPAAAIQGPGG